MRRAPPGPQLAVGRLRVDAARAIAKLREYQLADRSAWILEAIRGAVAAGATAIELRGDANDIWLAWDGAPIAQADLPCLFDELVSPEPTSERHHLRLLAAAVNSALGMNPAYVDVFAIDDTGALRVRYTPDVLAEPTGELADSPLRRLTATSVPIPDRARRGMLVHLRRRASLEVLGYFLDQPPELGLALDACRDLPIPLRVGATLIDRETDSRDVLRVALGDGLDGWLALVEPGTLDPASRGAVMEVAERGVVLARYPIELGLPEPRGPLPLRLFVDAARMPTNASRSQVRREAHPIVGAEARARQLVPVLVDRLCAELSDEPAERTRAAALGLLATAVAGASWQWDAQTLQPPLAKLAAAPLVRDATGATRPVTGPAKGWSGLVYTRRAPLPEELAPWVDDLIWIPPGDAAACLIGGIDAGAVRRQIRWARRQLRAHQRFFDHAPRAPHVEARTLPAIRVRLGVELADSCVPQAMFRGLTGEICLFVRPALSELVVLLQGRELDRQQFDSPVTFAAVIDAGRLTPADRYRGVERDDDYLRVERAMRAGILRAIECVAIALAGGELPNTCVLGDAKPAALGQLVREGLALALGAHVPIQRPLSAAPIWRTEETWLALDQLATHRVLGLVPPDVAVPAIPERLQLIVDLGDRALLDKLLPDVALVRYDQPWRRDVFALTRGLGAGVALVVEEGELLAAIAPADEPRLTLHHTGVKLDERAYASHLTPCHVAVDSPAIVPSANWGGVRDAAGLATRDYTAWETALMRAAARALTGDHVAELVGDGATDLASTLGRTLCGVLQRVDPVELLGAELAAALRARPLVPLLGEPGLYSAAELAERFPISIPYVDWRAVEVAGFHPLVGEAATARAVARLAGRACHDATTDLELHRRAAHRRQNRATHHLKPQQPLALPSAPEHVALGTHGVVGVSAGGLELEIRIDGRSFQSVQRADALPLVAVVELPSDRTDALFETVPDAVVDALIAEVTASTPTLLVAIAKGRPHALADPGRARTLLATWLGPSPFVRNEIQRAPIARETRDVLCEAVAFLTVQGERTSLEAASQPLGVLSTAAWQDSWLPPGDESADALDQPVLQLVEPSGELATIIHELHRGAVVDVTAELARLQAQRRMARGLLPVPAVPGVAPAWKRKLAELGDLGKKLGHGEIALVETGASLALLHVHGALVRRVPLDVVPPIHLAIEAPELIGEAALATTDLGIAEQLRALRLDDTKPTTLDAQAQELALRLVRKVLQATAPGALPDGIRRGLRRAVLARKLAPAELAGTLLFENVTGEWLDWAQLAQQLSRFGNVWSIAGGTSYRPLDEHRLVIRLDETDVRTASEHGFPVIEASEELELDATARRNLGRPPTQSLAITAHLPLGAIELDGDGTTAPRGRVIPLSPGSATARELRPHRAMYPFDVARDPCRWPTLAIIDDVRLSPDRTWSSPRADAVWKADLEIVRAASERALAALAPPPREALAVEQLTSTSHDAITVTRTPLQLRGALWLLPPSRDASATVQIVDASGRYNFTPSGGIAMGGIVYVHAAETWPVEPVMEQLCTAVHGRLLRALPARGDLDRDAVATHLAHGLALGRILPVDARKVTFGCFRPVPLNAAQLVMLLGGASRVVLVEPDASHFGLTDDGSELARVLLAWFGPRAQRELVAPVASRPPDPASVPLPQPPRTVLPLPPLPSPPEAPHPLRGLVDRLRARVAELGITVLPWTIEDTAAPMFRFTGTLRVAGDHPRLHALANALAARSPWAPAALDATVAHAVTVLNVALTEITDAAELHAIGALLADA